MPRSAAPGRGVDGPEEASAVMAVGNGGHIPGLDVRPIHHYFR